jgi:serine/threonine protein kinase
MKKLGKFEIISKVGQGAMGVVYKARDPFIDRIVALKTLTTGFAEDPHHLKRFYTEARSAGNLRHPNIVTIYELGHEGDTPFIAMQFLQGESLDKIIDRMPNLPLSQKIGFVVYVCRALEYAHKQAPPVIHRDVKPGNVMVCPDGAVVVVDFGIARLGESTISQSKGLLIGTFGYMSPQLFRGGTADARSDIWATGVMFYEILAYRRPFKGENAAALMSNIILEDHRPITAAAPGIPEEVRHILDRMLTKDVESRYQTMEEVLADLEPVWKRLLESDILVLLESSERLYQEGDLLAAKSEIVQILAWDPTNSTARSLSERISAEVRRQQIVPQLKAKVENAQKLLAEGHPEKARSEAESALRLDSSFQPAQEILAQARAAIDRAREIDLALRNSRQHLAEGALTDAETQLEKVLAIDPVNQAAQDQRKQIQDQRANRERDKEHDALLERARILLSNLQYDECIEVLFAARQQFPGDHEILKLLDTARREQQRLKEKQDLLKQRIREVEQMIERQELTEAIDLARQTITTIGPDPRLADTLAKAEREVEFREQKKREQAEKLEFARTLLDQGRLGDTESLVKEALETHLFSASDSRIVRLLQEIDAKKRERRPSGEPSGPTGIFSGVFSPGSRGGDPAKHYVFVRGTATPKPPAQADQNIVSAAAGAPASGSSSAGQAPHGSIAASFDSGVSAAPGSSPRPDAMILGLTGSSGAIKPPAIDPHSIAAESGWQDRHPQFLSAVERQLASFLGPIAGILTRRTAAQAKDPVDLISILAGSIHVESDRRAFLTRSHDLLQGLERQGRSAPLQERQARPETRSHATKPVGPPAALTPEVVRRASDLLARYLGPVSRILAERTLPRADSVKTFYILLADHLHNETERSRFLREAGFPE